MNKNRIVDGRYLDHQMSKSEKKEHWLRTQISTLSNDIFILRNNFIALQRVLKVSESSIKNELDKFGKEIMKKFQPPSQETKDSIDKAALKPTKKASKKKNADVSTTK